MTDNREVLKQCITDTVMHSKELIEKYSDDGKSPDLIERVKDLPIEDLVSIGNILRSKYRAKEMPLEVQENVKQIISLVMDRLLEAEKIYVRIADDGSKNIYHNPEGGIYVFTRESLITVYAVLSRTTKIKILPITNPFIRRFLLNMKSKSTHIVLNGGSSPLTIEMNDVVEHIKGRDLDGLIDAAMMEDDGS